MSLGSFYKSHVNLKSHLICEASDCPISFSPLERMMGANSASRPGWAPQGRAIFSKIPLSWCVTAKEAVEGSVPVPALDNHHTLRMKLG